MDYLIHIIIILNIYIILSVSSGLIVGLANLLSLGQAAFYGVGAYITAWGLMILGLSFIPALLLAVFITYVLSLGIGFLVVRFKGDYFVLATLGIQMIIYTVLYNWIAVTRGPYGIPGIPSPMLLGVIKISSNIAYLFVSSVLTLITVGLFYRWIHSPYGRALKAMRDNEILLKTQGRNVNRLKRSAFSIASAFAAVSGFLYATYISYIDPTSFDLDESIFILTAVLIGGTGNIKGPVWGAVFVVILPEILRFVGLPDAVAANMRMIIYGLIIILLMMYRPKGIAGVNKVS